MLKKICLTILVFIIFLLTVCTLNNTVNEVGAIEITGIVSSIGAVGENTNDSETQSFKFCITLTNNMKTDITIVSVKPILSEKFLEKVFNKDVIINVNRTVSQGGSLDVSGEIIFDSRGLTKEQISALEPFVEEVKIIHEIIIKKPF